MQGISLYPLFFFGKTKPQKGRRPSPLHTPGLFGETSALVLVWGSGLAAWYEAWVSYGGDFLCGDRMLGEASIVCPYTESPQS